MAEDLRVAKIPKEWREDYEAMPGVLRELLDAELAAGNEIVEVGHSFPAPPVGAYFKLAREVTTRDHADGGGISYRDRNSSIYSGEFTDAKRFFFILEPPRPEVPEPDMDAIRRARQEAAEAAEARVVPPAGQPGEDSALRRFERSMAIDYEKWHDGIGYDLDALREAGPEERRAIEDLLVSRGERDWRDVEALALLDSTRAKEALKAAIAGGDAQVRMAVMRHAPELVAEAERTASLVKALEEAEFYGGLTEALDEAAEFHPPEVVEALFQGALQREGEVAVHFAAMLAYVHGTATEPFDWDQRPFFLRFHTEDAEERHTAFRELCGQLGVDAERYLKRG